MFEREVKFIYDFSSSKIKKLGGTATYNDLIPLDLHPAIMRYIAAEIEYRVFEDRQTLLQHSMFDYSGSDIGKHFEKIADEIKKEKQFSTEFLSKVVLHATSFNINYLIRPNWSLKKLVFDTNESNSVAEINQILNYTYFYKHIPKVIREYFEKKKLISMNKTEFENLLEKLDRVSFESYGKDLLESAIKSMASFFSIGSVKKSAVPLQAIGVYLQEKNLTDHLAKLEEKLKGETKTKIEVNDLRGILFEVPLEKTETFDFHRPTKTEFEIEEGEKTEEETDLIEEESYESEESVDEEKETESESEPADEGVEDDEKLFTDEPTKKEVEEDVELRLRENKEKQVIEEEVSEENQENDKDLGSEILEEADEFLREETEDEEEMILVPEDEITEPEEPEETSEEESMEIEEERAEEEKLEEGEEIAGEEESEKEIISDDEEIIEELDQTFGADEEEYVQLELVDEDETLEEENIKTNKGEILEDEKEAEVSEEEEIQEEEKAEIEEDEIPNEVEEEIITENFSKSEDDDEIIPENEEILSEPEISEDEAEDLVESDENKEEDILEIYEKELEAENKKEEDEEDKDIDFSEEEMHAYSYPKSGLSDRELLEGKEQQEDDEIEPETIDGDEKAEDISSETELSDKDIEEESEEEIKEEVESTEENDKETDEKIEEKKESNELKEEKPRKTGKPPKHKTIFGVLPEDELDEQSAEEEKEEFIKQYGSGTQPKKIDIADLLENKNMTKIIAVIFDYDMEEFANAVEKICDSATSQEAYTILDEIFELNDVNPSSKEAQSFKEIISEYFEQN